MAQVEQLLDESSIGHFEQFLIALQAADNASRHQAEQALEQLRRHPDKLLLQLSNALVHSSSLESRQMASLVLRRQVCPNLPTNVS